MKRFMYHLTGHNSWVIRDHLLGADVCRVDDAKYADVICTALNEAAARKDIA